MKAIMILGIILIILGSLALVFQAISYTSKEKVLQLGPFQAERKETKTIPLPPVVGISVLAGGIILVVAGSRASRV